MFWVHCALFVLVIAVPGFNSSADTTSKREADYTLDDSFWHEENPTGEVEKLLREYRQNEELIRNIRTHSYQIIYPVQLRHHEKMGISTRDAGAPTRSGYSDGGYKNARGNSRTEAHFHRTSLLIKAFNHKFRLDLELNTQLLAPNLKQKDFLESGAVQETKQEIEHCYYHGTVRDYPGASAAFRTCSGVSGVIHLGNETFVIQPFFGGDLSKHPHIIFEPRTSSNKGCANTGRMENRKNKRRRQKHTLGLPEGTANRYTRDVRETIKYIETAIVIDKAMFDKRNGSSRSQVVHDAIQVANIADLYFRTLNTRVSVTYVETWLGGNQATINASVGISKVLTNFNDYTQRYLYDVSSDTTQLLTGETFQGGESGLATEGTVCSTKSVGVSVDVNTYEPHLLAGTMAHMIGHNIGMGHDDGRENCFCRDWHGCIMAKSIVGMDNVQPYKFSECSISDYQSALQQANGICLLNKPNEVTLRSCGNRVIDDGEQCDCGTMEECPDLDPCCDPITCNLKSESECATGPCCSNCKLRAHGHVCRESTNECDLPEVCTGETGQCPVDVYKKNGTPCSKDASYCFNGICPTLDIQCEQVWGKGGKAADRQCFEQFNSKGSINGHCGTDNEGHYVKCGAENVRCGSLQCQSGKKQPVIGRMEQPYLRAFITIKGKEYECKATTGKVEGSEMPCMGLVRDGTTCGENLICFNQTCTSRFPHIDLTTCPSNHNNKECSGNGACTNVNKCHCYSGWSGSDCSIQQKITTQKPTTSSTEKPGKSTTETKLQKKETPYEAESPALSTPAMVLILLGVVKGVFISFALMALCYRRKSTIQKFDPPYSLKPTQKTYTATSGNHRPEEAALDNVNKILEFGSMPSYSCTETQRVLFQSQNNISNVDGTRLKDYKPQMMRLGVEDEDGGTGAEEAVSFIDLPPKSLAKLPEKGILKKPGGYGMADGTMVDMQRTLNSLNGYHGHIMEALRNAESQRGMTSTPSGSSNLLDEEGLRKSLVDCGYSDTYRKLQPQHQQQQQQQQQQQAPQQQHEGQDHIDNQDDEDEEEDEEEDVPPCGPVRIRNLEDLIRQLEHHSARHMSPSGSEDMRISEGEADRHYRIDSSVCSESSQGSRRCSRVRDDDRFVYGRYRQPTARSPYGTHPHTHQHCQMHEEEGIYETADPDRGSNTRGDTPDSESDEFIQAQRRTAQWRSEARCELGGGGEEGAEGRRRRRQGQRQQDGGGGRVGVGSVEHRRPQQPPPAHAHTTQRSVREAPPSKTDALARKSRSSSSSRRLDAASMMNAKQPAVADAGDFARRKSKVSNDSAITTTTEEREKLRMSRAPDYCRFQATVDDVRHGLDERDVTVDNDEEIGEEEDNASDFVIRANDLNDDKINVKLDYDCNEIIEYNVATNAQSHHDQTKLLNNNDDDDDNDDAILTNVTRINPDENAPLVIRSNDHVNSPDVDDDDDDDDDKRSTIVGRYGATSVASGDRRRDEAIQNHHRYQDHHHLLYDNDHDDDDDDDDLNDFTIKNNTSNNTSDNENTALLPPSHFPEYKH